MKVNTFIIFLCLMLPALAVNDEAPEFDYGFGESHFKWGIEIPISKNESDLNLRIGTRLQTVLEDSSSTGSAGNSVSGQDFYIRRARLQVEAKFKKDISYYMDIRADKVDKGNSGSNGFQIGDAFLQIKNIFKNKNLKLRLFRSKFDISRTQTVSSSRLLVPLRVAISDYASEYISHSRRGTNMQLLGNWSNKVKTQVVLGDSIHESKFKDSLDKGTATLNGQNFAMGARLRFSPFSGWEEKGLKETFFGQGQHLTLGAGYFRVDNINFTTSGRTFKVDRELKNFELSFHYGPLSISGEYYIFDGVIDDFSASNFRKGKSTGWFTQGEFVFTNFHYIAPFVRYQSWNRFKSNANFSEKSTMLGLNYYMKGNKLRLGLYYDKTEYDTALASAAGYDKKIRKIGTFLMMHY